jgi:hypothetical protein
MPSMRLGAYVVRQPTADVESTALGLTRRELGLLGNYVLANVSVRRFVTDPNTFNNDAKSRRTLVLEVER